MGKPCLIGWPYISRHNRFFAVRRNPKVGLSMTDPGDPYRFVSVRGAVSQINDLARRYLDVEEYPGLDEEGARVQIRIRPTDVTAGQG